MYAHGLVTMHRQGRKKKRKSIKEAHMTEQLTVSSVCTLFTADACTVGGCKSFVKQIIASQSSLVSNMVG
jgi:hypothetical protein